jgi:hypothetical protein
MAVTLKMANFWGLMLWSGGNVILFQRNMLPPFSDNKNKPCRKKSAVYREGGHKGRAGLKSDLAITNVLSRHLKPD